MGGWEACCGIDSGSGGVVRVAPRSRTAGSDLCRRGVALPKVSGGGLAQELRGVGGERVWRSLWEVEGQRW